MAKLMTLDEYRPPKLTHVDGEPVKEIPGLVWWQDMPLPDEAWFEIAGNDTNGWLEDVA